jgi:hypothetical protein
MGGIRQYKKEKNFSRMIGNRDIVNRVSDLLGEKKSSVESIFDTIFFVIREELAGKENSLVTIKNFGSFSSITNKAGIKYIKFLSCFKLKIFLRSLRKVQG